jgi:hypothetical protein
MIANPIPLISNLTMRFGSMIEIVTLGQYGKNIYTIIFETYEFLIEKD